jgi:hypothetical protein
MENAHIRYLNYKIVVTGLVIILVLWCLHSTANVIG